MLPWPGTLSTRISELFLDEVSEVADDFLRYQLDGVVKVYSLEVLTISAEDYELADAHVRPELSPRKPTSTPCT
ncbi:MAG: hypothetical protein HY319_01175 [Armatimonadetes bacterium]|nr:hypothetical protein [Armatimonadota bacterium]